MMPVLLLSATFCSVFVDMRVYLVDMRVYLFARGEVHMHAG